MNLSVVIPTVVGREALFERCVAAVCSATHPVEIVPVRGERSWGAAAAVGLGRATGEFILVLCDDFIMERGPWSAEATAICQEGGTPIATILGRKGEVQSQRGWLSVMPMLSREQWDRVGAPPPIHYADVIVAERCHEEGIPFVPCPSFRATHEHDWYPGERSHDAKRRELATHDPLRVARWRERGGPSPY